tara:strand:+ start:673 stop:1566 length:894 start_codon:yes stop_codon:yes gene_type:complete
MKDLTAAFLLPVFNAQKTIERSIKSILEQDYKEFRLIIIENGSTDNTRRIIQKAKDDDDRIVLYNLDNASLTNALCFGIKKIKEDLILRIDSDDVCESNRLSKTIEYMTKNPKVDISYTDFQDIYKNKSNLIIPPKKITYSDIIYKNLIAHSTYCIRKKSLEKYNLNYSGIEGKKKYFGPSQDLMLISSGINNFNFKISKIEGTKVLIYKNNKSISTINYVLQKRNAAKILFINSLNIFTNSKKIKDWILGFTCLSINLARLLYHKTNLKVIKKIIDANKGFKHRKEVIDYSFILSI